jgi:hypothetical protein
MKDFCVRAKRRNFSFFQLSVPSAMRSPLPIVIIIIAGVLIWATFSTGVNGQAEEEQVFVDLLRFAQINFSLPICL